MDFTLDYIVPIGRASREEMDLMPIFGEKRNQNMRTTTSPDDASRDMGKKVRWGIGWVDDVHGFGVVAAYRFYVCRLVGRL